MSMGCGWRSSTSAVGGIPRTFGLHRQFEKDDSAPPTRIDRATFQRIVAYFKPYWVKWLIGVSCIVLSAGLSVLPL